MVIRGCIESSVQRHDDAGRARRGDVESNRASRASRRGEARRLTVCHLRAAAAAAASPVPVTPARAGQRSMRHFRLICTASAVVDRGGAPSTEVTRAAAAGGGWRRRGRQKAAWEQRATRGRSSRGFLRVSRRRRVADRTRTRHGLSAGRGALSDAIARSGSIFQPRVVTDERRRRRRRRAAAARPGPLHRRHRCWPWALACPEPPLLPPAAARRLPVPLDAIRPARGTRSIRPIGALLGRVKRRRSPGPDDLGDTIGPTPSDHHRPPPAVTARCRRQQVNAPGQ